MNPSENFIKLKQDIPTAVTIVAVSKTFGVDRIMEIYRTGHRIFGENKVQELTAKQPQLPSDILWHFIGHLQTNKVKHIIPFVNLIHSVDSVKLLSAINQEAGKLNKKTNCLVQIKIAKEISKYGLMPDEAADLFTRYTNGQFPNTVIRGLMGMASFTSDSAQVKEEFLYLKSLFDYFSRTTFAGDPYFKELSMGMSSDYEIAIGAGATIIRLGSLVFGKR